MCIKKSAVNAPDYKSRGVSSGNTIAAQRQQQHAAGQGITTGKLIKKGGAK
jgi:hypothetical protein